MARGSRANTDPKPSEKKEPDEDRIEDEEQYARFIETARKLGTDESGEKFERAMGEILKPKKGKS
ncbi:MAG: hypothetical protein R3F54_15515 [Alphaproteobacteria bacterium]